jgi:uncharacterized membrane protein HdeD (DUF308 family)
MGAQSDNKSNIQLIWGIALAFVGIAVFFKVTQVMPDLEIVQQRTGIHVNVQVFLICLMGVILLGGGIKKLIRYYQLSKGAAETTNPEGNNTNNESSNV